MPHNNPQQASQEATYMKPEEVDFTKPFKFHPRTREDALFEFFPHNKEVTWEHGDEPRSASYDVGSVLGYVNNGYWLVIKQPESTQEEDMLSKSFRFESYGYKYAFCNDKVYHDHGGFCCDYSKEWAKDYLASGHWKLLPSETSSQNAPKPSLEETFTLAENAAKEALKPIEREAWEPSTKKRGDGYFVCPDCGSQRWGTSNLLAHEDKWIGHCNECHFTWYRKNDDSVFTFDEGVAECKPTVKKVNLPAKYFSPDASEEDKAVLEATMKLLNSINAQEPNSLLDTIKNACTQSQGRIVVQVTEDGFDIYHRVFFEDFVHVKEQKLEEFLKALLLIDGADKWE